MADYAQDPKVEDVLSSVRRLVSQELPTRSAAKVPPEDGALVLTPDDRIKADHQARVAARSLEQRIAQLEAAVDSGSDEFQFEPDGSEDQAQHRPDRIVYTRPRSSETEVGQERSPLRLSEISVIAPTTEVDVGEGADAPVEFRSVATRSVDEAPMAEDVPTLPAKGEVRAFSDPDDVVARIEARIERGEDVSKPPPVPTSPPVSEDFDTALSAAVRASISATEDVKIETNPADTLSFEETFADPAPELKSAVSDTAIDPDEAPGALEGTVRKQVPTVVSEPEAPTVVSEADPPRVAPGIAAPVQVAKPQPDAPVEEPKLVPPEPADASLRAPVSADAPKRGIAATVTTKPDQTEVSPTEAAANALSALPAEEAMRLLVGRLLREELQGELGKQITRNVRKLVRSEILRVLETRTLD